VATITAMKRATPIGIAKALTGVRGFDEMTSGGLPCGKVSVIIGDAGSGKTVFALQTLANAARDRGEPGIFVAFEESAERIVTNAASSAGIFTASPSVNSFSSMRVFRWTPCSLVASNSRECLRPSARAPVQ
jgi:RecA/RadA recombinase